ncbi:MAG: NADH-quinone oxidoreductase subunit NuoH [Gemmataceae bacterium]|nr:NADH-quinone oxidoreductase subunit NuoH [Gemmataceae bacterium]
MTPFHFWTTAITIAVVLFVVLHVVAYMILVERKVSAWMQDRLGPNRVGPWGLLQPIVDGAKMFLKEDIIPSHVDKVFYILAPGVAAFTALVALAVVPFGPTDPSQPERYQFVIAPNIDIGILWTFSTGSMAVYGVILGGWSSNNKYSLLGSLRSSAQVISYEIPLGLSVLGVILYAGSLNLERIIDWQVQHGWNALYHPLAFLMFVTAAFAECNRLPFDLPECEQELVGGYHTEYSSIKFGLFFLGEYTHMITTSLLFAVLFCGGWHLPFGLTDGNEWYHTALKLVSILGKTAFFLFFYVWVRWTLPRFRFDQLMGIAWKLLIPLATVNLVVVMVLREYEAPLWALTAASVALFVGATAFAARQTTPPVIRRTGNIHGLPTRV